MVGSVAFGLLQSRCFALSHMLFACKGSFISCGLDWRNAVVVGWKSASLTIVGVMKIRRLSLSSDLFSLRKAYPRSGMSPRTGTLVYEAFGLSLTRPPMTRVLELGIRTWVSM